MTNTTHYVPANRDKGACGKTTAAMHMDENLFSSRAQDTTCIGCKNEFQRMADLGFFPKN